MRWIIILFALLILGSLNSFAWGFGINFDYYLLIAFCLYLGFAVSKLKSSQQQLRDDLERVEKQLRSLQMQAKPAAKAIPEVTAPEVQTMVKPTVIVPDYDPWMVETPIWQDAPNKSEPAPATEKTFEPVILEKPAIHQGRIPDNFEAVPAEPTAFENWLAGGNWIVRGGLAILFLGLVFLAKFAYDHVSIPLELRLAAIGAVGLVLLMVGWRSRLDKPTYGLSLQGGGVATLYLTVFATVKLTGQLPTAIALPLMLTVGILAALLAIKQDAMVLAVIGTIGGFMAPVLLSDGHGSHIGLFSYYAVLTVGVMTVALRKAWRPLNLLAFFFTYGVAGLWGMDRYRPEFILSCLLFLVLFFCLFVAITLFFTKRQTDAGETDLAIDASLLFGVPAASFGFAFYMLKPYEYGGAIAAVLFSAVYCGLAFYARDRASFNALKTPWAAMGLLFATLAVPLACDPRLTSSIWALEGAAVIWYSWQQAATKARLFGYLLITVGTIGFISHWPDLDDTLPIFNASSIGLSILVLAYGVIGVASNRIAQADPDNTEADFISSIAAIAVAVTGGILIGTELFHRNPWSNASLAIPFLLWLWAWGLQWFAQRQQWSYLTGPVLVLPILTLVLPLTAFDAHSSYSGPELAGISAALIALLAWQAISLKKLLPDLPNPSKLSGILALPGLSVVLFWWLLLVRGRYSFSAALNPDDGLSMRGWFIPLAAAIPMLLLWWLCQRHYRENETSPRLWQILHGSIELPDISLAIQRRSFVLIVLLYILATTFFYSGAHPSFYLPVLNLYELIAIGGLMALLNAARYSSMASAQLFQKLGLLSFVFANSILSRILANHFGADFEFGFAWHSAIAATSYSIVWTIAALIAMWMASKKARRGLWIAGAGLLGVVAVKLILIDQAQVGTLARIISFLGVGALMLVIGYVAPIPAEDKLEK